MRVLHITPSFYPALIYGGPTQSVYQLCCALVRNNCEVRVLTTDANGPDAVLDIDTSKDVEVVSGLWVRYCHRILNASISPALLRMLAARIRSAHLVHLTAVYSFPTIPTLLFCKLFAKPTVWSPRGSLQRWQGSRRVRLKRKWEQICRAAAPQRLVLHLTSEEEATESVKIFPGVKCVVVPNGVEIPEKVNHSRTTGPLRLTFLGRLNPIKGIENLLAACNILKSSASVMYSLTIAGAGDQAYIRTLRDKIASLSLSRQVTLIGEVWGEEKQKLFEDTDIVVVPSYKENFGMVVAEALAHGLPVIASKGTPWQRLEEMKCGLWVDNNPESLATAIRQMSEMPLDEFGRRGLEWMQKEFSWDGRAKLLIDTYSNL